MMTTRTDAGASRGFTLVETLVAIAILMIAIVGPYYSIQQAITTSFVARDQLIASQLAQEGQEFIYYERDRNYLQQAQLNNGTTWLANLDPCFSSAGCTVDPLAVSFAQCPVGGCPPLLYNSTGQYYTQSGQYPATRFTRTVKMVHVPANDPNSNQVESIVTVSWSTEHRTYSVVTTEELYNWL